MYRPFAPKPQELVKVLPRLKKGAFRVGLCLASLPYKDEALASRFGPIVQHERRTVQ
jgi:hypothetical protein